MFKQNIKVIAEGTDSTITNYISSNAVETKVILVISCSNRSG